MRHYEQLTETAQNFHEGNSTEIWQQEDNFKLQMKWKLNTFKSKELIYNWNTDDFNEKNIFSKHHIEGKGSDIRSLRIQNIFDHHKQRRLRSKINQLELSKAKRFLALRRSTTKFKHYSIQLSRGGVLGKRIVRQVSTRQWPWLRWTLPYTFSLLHPFTSYKMFTPIISGLYNQLITFTLQHTRSIHKLTLSSVVVAWSTNRQVEFVGVHKSVKVFLLSVYSVSVSSESVNWDSEGELSLYIVELE